MSQKKKYKNLWSRLSFNLELYYKHGTVIVEITLASKKATAWCLKKSHTNDKFLGKGISSSYKMESETLLRKLIVKNSKLISFDYNFS